MLAVTRSLSVQLYQELIDSHAIGVYKPLIVPVYPRKGKNCTHAQRMLPWAWHMSTLEGTIIKRQQMASGSSSLLEPTLRRTSFQDRKYDVQADERRGSIDAMQAGARENALVQLKTALSTALTVLHSGAGKYCDMVVKDPDLTSKLESAFRLTSYIVPGAL